MKSSVFRRIVWILVLASTWGWVHRSNAATQWTEKETTRGYVAFVHSTLAQRPTNYVPTRKAIVSRIGCTLAQGEYQSVQVGVHALNADLQDLRLNLVSPLEARIYRPIDEPTRRLLAAGVNPVPGRMKAPGADYANGRHPVTVIDLQAACLDESDVIATLGKGTTSYFWLTLHASEHAAPGRHAGRIRIQPAGRLPVELDLEVTVRPFKLERARIAFAQCLYHIYYQRHNYLPEFAQNLEWYGKIFRDMAEHSLTSVISLGSGERSWAIDWSKRPPENDTFAHLLPMATAMGLASPGVPMITDSQTRDGPDLRLNFDRRLTVEQKNDAVDWYEAERLKRGWPELICYARDEPHYPEQAALVRGESGEFRDVRMRLATSMNANAAYGLGDIHDIWIVFAGQVTPEMIREARRMGAEVWSYTCRMYAAEPLRVRHYAGLYTWAYRLKGQEVFAHYAFQYYKNIWVREGDERPMPMVGWETRREGIDDYRYLQMLEDCVAANPDLPPAVEAREWMERLRARVMPVDPHAVAPGKPLALDEYDRIREQAAQYIQQLGPVPTDRVRRDPVTRLKDEAQQFRGKTVQECIEGLKSGDVGLARAAAWAIREMGGQGAPAVPALVDLLDEPEVRMPVFRALEAIGPASLPALPKLRELIEHPDGFVRLGATYAAGAIGAPAIDVLTQAARDDYIPVPYAVLRRLAQLDSNDTLPALPVLIELLDKASWEGGPALVLKTIGALGPQANAAGEGIVKLGQRYLMDEGCWPSHDFWLNPLIAIGAETKAVPMLEEFLQQQGSNPAFPTTAVARCALYKVRRSPEDLRVLVALIGKEGGGPRDADAALVILEHWARQGKAAAPAAPWVRQLMGRAELSEQVRQRLTTFLKLVEPDD